MTRGVPRDGGAPTPDISTSPKADVHTLLLARSNVDLVDRTSELTTGPQDEDRP